MMIKTKVARRKTKTAQKNDLGKINKGYENQFCQILLYIIYIIKV